MSLLSKALQTKAAIPSGPYRSLSQFQLLNGRLVSITDNQDNYIKQGYSINDIIYSIITLIMDKIKVAPWAVYSVKDEGALKTYHGMQQRKNWQREDFTKAKDLRFKALELVKSPGKLGELMKYANEYETFPEFVGNGCGYKLLTGNKYVWADLLSAGANKGLPNELWNLPSQWTQIKATDTFPCDILSYLVSIWQDKNFPAEEVLHEKYWNPSYDINGQQLYGVAPLRAALKLLNRDNSSLDASAAAFQNEGIKGVLHMKGDPNNANSDTIAGEVRKLKKEMVTEWVGEKSRGKMGLSGYDMGWLPIGLSSEEMQQIENEKWNLRRLCSVWGVQSQLLNDPDNKTYNNQEEAEKALTTRCALPALTAFRDNFNRKLRKDWGGRNSGWIVDFDMTVYSELADDLGKMITAIVPLLDRGMPLNTGLDIVGLEKINNPYYDMPRVTPTMGQSFDEHEMSEMDLVLQDES